MYEKSPFKMELGKDENFSMPQATNIETNCNISPVKVSLGSLILKINNLEKNYISRDEMKSQFEDFAIRFKKLEEKVIKYENESSKKLGLREYQDENRQGDKCFQVKHEENKIESPSINEIDENITSDTKISSKKRKLLTETTTESQLGKKESFTANTRDKIDANALIGNIVDALVDELALMQPCTKKIRLEEEDRNVEEYIAGKIDQQQSALFKIEVGTKDESTNTDTITIDIEKKDETTNTEPIKADAKKDESTNTEQSESKMKQDESTNTELPEGQIKKDESTSTEDDLLSIKLEDNENMSLAYSSNNCISFKEEKSEECAMYEVEENSEDDKEILSKMGDLYYPMSEASSTHVCKICSKDATNIDDVKSHIMDIHLYYIKS